MTVLLVILVLLAVAFGLGALVKGILWLLVIGLVLLAVGALVGYHKLRNAIRDR